MEKSEAEKVEESWTLEESDGRGDLENKKRVRVTAYLKNNDSTA